MAVARSPAAVALLDEQVQDGPFIDHLVRQLATRGNFTSDSVAMLLRPGSIEVEKQHLAYAWAQSAVNREKMYWTMREAILKEQKANDNPVWKLAPKTFTRRAKECMSHLHKANMLKSQVTHWVLHKTIHQLVINSKETSAMHEKVETRHDRLQDFWPALHNVPSKTSAPAGASSKPKSESRALSPSRSTTPSMSTRPGSRSTASRPLSQAEWKERSARSQCSAGGWEWWAHGSGKSLSGTMSSGGPYSVGLEDSDMLPLAQSFSSKFSPIGMGTKLLTASEELSRELGHHDAYLPGFGERNRGGSMYEGSWGGSSQILYSGNVSLAGGSGAMTPEVINWSSQMSDDAVDIPEVPEDVLAEKLLPMMPQDDGSQQHSQNKYVRWWQKPPYAKAEHGIASVLGKTGTNSRPGSGVPNRLLTLPAEKKKRKLKVPGVGAQETVKLGNLSEYVESRHSVLAKSASLPSIGSGSVSRGSRGRKSRPTSGASQMLDDLQKTQLPQMEHKFRQPYQGQSQVKSKNSLPIEKYLTVCKSGGLVPLPLPFVTGHSSCLRAAEKGLKDKDLAAICEMLKEMALQKQEELKQSAALGESVQMEGSIEELDLESNPRLSERALRDLFLFLAGRTSHEAAEDEGAGGSIVGTNLARLSLRKCPSMGQEKAVGGLISLLEKPKSGLRSLRALNLSGVPLSVRCQLSLCQVIGSHPILKEVNLADTGLGGGIASNNSEDQADLTRQCIVELVSSSSLEKLDLSWNCFDKGVFLHLGQKLNESGSLKQLSLSHCAAVTSMGPRISPIVFFLEQLTNNHSIESLGVRENNIDFRGALILEDALENNTTLKDVDVSQNALGIIGLRSLMRVLSRPTSALVEVSFEQCGRGALMDASTDFQTFRASDPQGRYNLDLERPYHRSLLRMLYKTADRLKLSPDAAFSNLVASPPYAHPSKDSYGIYQVPTTGSLSISFTMEKALEEAVKGLPEDPDFQGVLRAHADLLRIRPPPEKVVPLLCEWRRVECLGEEQAALIDALSKDFILEYQHVAQLCMTRDQIPDVVGTLMTTLRGGPCERYMCGLLIKSMADYVKMITRSSSIINFNPENATGHYNLDMSLPVDYNVAENLIVIDNWEMNVRARRGQTDVSQLGDGSHARNVQYGDHFLGCTLAAWIQPEYGILKLDYSSSKRPPDGCVPIGAAAFEEFVAAIQEFSKVDWQDRMQALRKISDQFYITALQLRQLLGLFQEAEARADIFVLFYNRLSDIQSEKIVRVRFDTEEELAAILQRLGYSASLPFLQPEQCHFNMDMRNYDERLAASLLLRLANREQISNLKNPKFTHSDGTEDPLPLGVPRSWEALDKLPKEGVFEVDYVCSPEDRNFGARKELLSNIGGWNVASVQEDAVAWWTGIHQAPADVIAFVFWVISNYGDVFAAFYDIDGGGPAGDPEITIREFEEGARRIGCKKFKGADESQRLCSIFRYLDPSGEGKVSMSEWAVLSQVQQEIKLSIKEFVQFCERNFGPDLGDAWNFMDEDGGGEITVDEWTECCEKVQYFGPTMPIFKYIDKDDGGSIEEPEFKVLGNFQGITLEEAIYGKK